MKKNILIIGVVLIFITLFVKVFELNSNLAKEVSSNKILGIKIGMTTNQVKKIMGSPIEIESKGNFFTYCYSKPPKFSDNYPMLWIHFDKNFKVCEVYAKLYTYFGLDDIGIYGLSADRRQWIDESNFYNCF